MSLDFSRHPKDLDEVLSHLNAGETQNNDGDRVGDTYRALERLFNYYNRIRREHWRRFTASRKLRNLVTSESFYDADKTALCNSEALEKLLLVDPPIQDNNSNSSRPHEDAKDAFRDYKKEGGEGTRKRLLKSVAELLLIIRNNSFHGQKPLRHPDQARVNRDREIFAGWLGVVELLFDGFLETPNHRLAVLEEDRHGLNSLDHGGEWSTKCRVVGKVESKGGRQAFSWTYKDTKEWIDVQVLQSDQLLRLQPQITAIYGQDYCRICVPVEIDGKLKACGIYTAKSEME